jgi:hypothetical protein
VKICCREINPWVLNEELDSYTEYSRRPEQTFVDEEQIKENTGDSKAVYSMCSRGCTPRLITEYN